LGFDVFDVGSSAQSPLGILKYISVLRKAIRRSKADICLTFTIRPAIWGNFVTRSLGIPTITNITGVGPLFASNSLTYRMARKLYRIALKRTRTIFFQNRDDQSLFVKHKFTTLRGSSLIPGSGVDHELFSPRPCTAPDGKFVFLYIARLLKDKGICEYVDAARMVRKEFPHVHFIVVGPYWHQNLKENTITAAQVDSWVREGTIEYKGELSDVRDVIAGCHCLVLPSYREGTSNVLLEAGSMEKPCITCDTPGCREIVMDKVTGYLCKVADAEDLADKMRDMIVLSEESRLEMGKAARQKVIKEFDKKIVVNIYLNAIAMCLEK
jgi:glycosyltransferase involved in cell wall biosynthesis